MLSSSHCTEFEQVHCATGKEVITVLVLLCPGCQVKAFVTLLQNHRVQGQGYGE